MKGNKSIAVFRQYIIPLKESFNVIEDIQDRFPESSVYFCGNRHNLKQEEIDILKNIIPLQQIFLYDVTNKFSKIQYFFRLKQQRFDIGIISVSPSSYSFPTHYRTILFTYLCVTKKIMTYDIEKNQLYILKRSSFYKLLLYDFFILCLFIISFPVIFILLIMLAYHRCQIAKYKTVLYRN